MSLVTVNHHYCTDHQHLDMESSLRQLIQGKALLLIIVLGIGGTFQIACHLTLISSPSPYIKSFINTSLMERYGTAPADSTVTFIWSAVVAIYAFGALFGSISVQWVSNWLGRKRAMIWNNAINVIALAIMSTSRLVNSFEIILISRFLFGWTSGLSGNMHLLYLGESSPKKIRGMVMITAAIFASTGKLTGQIAGLSEILGGEEQWNILLSLPAFFSVIQMVALPFFPEAPRYLLIEKGDAQQCKEALQWLWGEGDYKLEMEEMLEEQAALKGVSTKTVLQLFKDRSVRWQLLTLFVIIGGIQFCGISAISVFSFSIFQEAGIPVDKIRYVTLGVGVSEILTIMTCGLLIDRVGRRVLLLAGFLAMGVIMTLIAITLELKDYSSWVPYSTVSLIFLFVVFYGGGPGGVMPSLTNEMFVQSYRSAAFVFMGILMWVSKSLLGFIFPFLLASTKSFSFILFSSVCLTGALYVYFVLPETKGKTPLEISEDFRNIRLCGSHTKDVILETWL